jgi:hypothetical protein
VEKEHQCSGLAFFAALAVVFAVTVGINYSQVVKSRQHPPTSVSAAQEPHWQLPNMVSRWKMEGPLETLPGPQSRVLLRASAAHMSLLDLGLIRPALPPV